MKLVFGIIAITFCFAVSTVDGLSQVKPIKIKPLRVARTKVKEPSDVAFIDKDKIALVSDNGHLYTSDFLGEITKKSAFSGTDFEGVCFDGEFIYVVEEFTSRVHKINATSLERIQTYPIQFQGGRNKGFEAICYNPKKKTFILVSEQSPMILETNADFQVQNITELKNPGEVSAAAFYKDKLWLLSDEEMTISKLNADSYAVESVYQISINNPEGLTFSASDQMIVCSDDGQSLYYFKVPE